MTTTQGVSPKTLAAGVAPTAGGVIVALVNLAITGTFDTTSIAALIAGSAGGLTSTIAAFIAKPGVVHEVAVDAAAAVKAVEAADPHLVGKVESFVKKEEAKLPAPFHGILGALDDDVLDPILAGITPDPGPGLLVGDAGQPSAPPPDPRDAEIASLRQQLAQATQGPIATAGADFVMAPVGGDPIPDPAPTPIPGAPA